MSPIPPGTYTIEAEVAGYKRAREQNVVIAGSGPATVNISLVAGNPKDVVNFTATAPAIQTDHGEINVTLNEIQIKELPIIDRNHQQLIGLQSGITPPTTLFTLPQDPDRNRFYSTNGQSPFINNYTVDGLSNLEPNRGSEIRVHPVENIHDMLISTSNYTEDKGFSGGAVVNTTTMTGTNQLHGSLFEFNSNNDLRSRNSFSNGISDNRLVYNQFGATVGGPVVKNSTFAFASYEGTYRRGSETELSTVPTADVLSGNFNAVPGLVLFSPFSGTASGTGRTTLPGNIIPGFLINPTSAAIASFFPAPNHPGYVNNYVTNVPVQHDLQRLDGRIDQNFSGNTSAFLRYGYTNGRGYEASPLGNVVGASSLGRNIGQNAAIDLTHIFGPALIAEARFGYNRYTDRYTTGANLDALAASGPPLSSFNGQLFSVNIPGLAAIGSPTNAPMYGVDNTFNWAGTVSWKKSAHDLKFGLDVNRIRTDGFFWSPFGINGTANFGPGATMLNSAGATITPTNEFFNSFAAFLLGTPSQFGVSQPVTPPSIRQTQWGMWAGDHVNILPRLTIDFGIRYEIYLPLTPRRTGGAAYYDPTTNLFNLAGVNGNSMSGYAHTYDDIAPRFGFAYRATDKTVVRGGYGISYFQPAYMGTGFLAPVNGAVAGVNGTYAIAALPNPFGSSLASSLLPPTPSLTAPYSAGNAPLTFFPGNLDTPYVQSFSLQVQQEFKTGTVLSAGYVGTLGRHLPFNYELNAAAPGTGVAGLPLIGFGRTASTFFHDNAITNNYNSLQVSLTRRFTHGLGALASYTYGKALGYTTANGTLLDSTDLHANYGPLDYDRRHILSIAHMWEIPFNHHSSHWMNTLLGGWQLNGILTWQTGTPLTVTANPLLCNCPGNTVLASLNGTTPPVIDSGASFLNPAAFSIVPGATSGNLGRGALRGPDTTNYNMSLFKRFRWRDRYNFEFRGEAYNVTNTTHFANPNTNFSSLSFGQSQSTLEGFGNRQLNVGFRATF
jgi:hypothetical protein